MVKKIFSVMIKCDMPGGNNKILFLYIELDFNMLNLFLSHCLFCGFLWDEKTKRIYVTPRQYPSLRGFGSAGVIPLSMIALACDASLGCIE